MRSLIPAAVVLILAAIAAWLLLGPQMGARGPRSAPEDGPGASRDPDALLVGRGSGPHGEGEPLPGDPVDAPTQAGASAPSLFLTGRLLAASTGAPIAGATVFAEAAQTPCPRLPRSLGFDQGVAFPATAADLLRLGGGRTDAEGRFEIVLRQPPASVVDVFAAAPGHVMSVTCAAALDQALTIHLQRGLTLLGRVEDPQGQPIANAALMAEPSGTTPRTLGHFSRAASGEDGGFLLDGLSEGEVSLSADHALFMPAVFGPFDPLDRQKRILVLEPAHLVSFRLRTADGLPIQNPSLEWSTQEDASKRLALLDLIAEEGSEPWFVSRAHRVPASEGAVTFWVKANDYAPWTQTVRPSSDVGEEQLEVVLERNLAQGSVVVLFEEEGGKRVPYSELGAQLRIERMDGRTVPAGIVVIGGEALRFPAIPAGPYRFTIYSPRHAPVTESATVEEGQETPLTGVLRPSARLRIRFLAAEAMTVPFRILWGGRPVPAFRLREDGTADLAPTAEEEAPLLGSAEGSHVFGGLASGRHVIEVVAPDLVAPATAVTLVEGDAVEVDIRVDRRR